MTSLRRNRVAILVAWCALCGAALGIGALDEAPPGRRRPAEVALPAVCLIAGWIGFRLSIMISARSARGSSAVGAGVAALVAALSVGIARLLPRGLAGLVVLGAVSSMFAGLMVQVLMADHKP